MADGDRRCADAGEAEMIGAVVVTSTRKLVGLNRQVKGFCCLLYFRIEVRALGPADIRCGGNADRVQHVIVQVERDLRRGNRRMHAQPLRAEQSLLFSGDRSEVDAVWRLRFSESA